MLELDQHIFEETGHTQTKGSVAIPQIHSCMQSLSHSIQPKVHGHGVYLLSRALVQEIHVTRQLASFVDGRRVGERGEGDKEGENKETNKKTTKRNQGGG